MHPDLAMLVVLQSHDIEAKRLRGQIAALPRLVAALELKAAATVGQRTVVLDLIAKEEALRRRQESEIADQKQKLARTQKKIDISTTSVQVTALQHEAAFARAEINRLEDAELESMERGEALDAQRAGANQAVAEAASKLEQERARTDDLLARDRAALAEVDAMCAALRAQIELEIRLALDSLKSSEDQVQVAREGLEQAERETAQAQRRYEAGVASSLEPTDAQTRLARARDNRIAALLGYNVARINLAQAMGAIRQIVQLQRSAIYVHCLVRFRSVDDHAIDIIEGKSPRHPKLSFPFLFLE